MIEVGVAAAAAIRARWGLAQLSSLVVIVGPRIPVRSRPLALVLALEGGHHAVEGLRPGDVPQDALVVNLEGDGVGPRADVVIAPALVSGAGARGLLHREGVAGPPALVG